MGAKDNSYLRDHQWEVGLGYRWLTAGRFFIGHDSRPDASFNAAPIDYKINTLDLSLTYALSSRFSASLLLPFAFGTQTLLHNDRVRHSVSVNGIGDLSLVGSAWLLQPLTHANGNVAMGLGVKAPTGSHSATGPFYGANGISTSGPVDGAMQTGDGGWGIVLQMSAFQRVAPRLSAYAAGDYLVSPRVHNDVMGGPGASNGAFGIPVTPGLRNYVSVADEYSAHGGLAYALWPRKNLAVSLGGRLDGVPVNDLIGGGDIYFRRPGYVVYLEPGVSLTLAKSPFSRTGSTFTLSVPVAVDRNRQWSVREKQLGQNAGGDFADYLIFFGYSLRL